MSNFQGLDLVVDWIKQIVDGVRCTICDRTDEGRCRYACGHTACTECIATVNSCLLCLTPPAHSETLLDEPLTRRVKHVTELLCAFQDTFHVDVFRRHRVSEKLKLEKELFPQCIQAPQTYYNKRRSSKSISHRDRHCIIPGEVVETPRMDSSKNYVQEWLEKNENELSKYKPRKAFTDLKVNSPRFNKSPIKRRADIILEKVKESENIPISSNIRKRSFKTALGVSKSQSLLDKYLHSTEKGNSIGNRRNAKEVRREFEYHEKPAPHRKNEKDESGIVMDEDFIVIEDSQNQVLDKDREAWLAVLKASSKEENKLSQDTTANNYPATVGSLSLKDLACNIPERSNNETKPTSAKVPFYKKSCFLAPMNMFDNQEISKRSSVDYKAKDVSITVESNTLVTTIKVSRCTTMVTNKVSTSIQTDPEEDISENQAFAVHYKKDTASKTHVIKNKKLKLNAPCSADVFNSQEVSPGIPNITKDSETDFAKENKSVMINDSDSDSQHEHSSLLVVTADIHQPRDSDFIQRGTLTEIRDTTRAKKPLSRRRSPVSSNSSNKENHDPNAKKKPRKLKKAKQNKVRF